MAPEKLSVLELHQKSTEKGLWKKMSEPRLTAATIQRVSPRALGQTFVAQMTAATHSSAQAFTQVGVWAGETAQQFGTLVAILMGPAVFSAYAFAAWALAGNLGWTDTFIFTSGALSNWIIWLGAAVLVNTAAVILKKHTRVD